MKELDLGGKTYFVVDDSLPAVCFKVLEDTAVGEYLRWAQQKLLHEPNAIPKGVWHPVIQHFMLTRQSC